MTALKRTPYLWAMMFGACVVSPEPGSPEATIREVVSADEWMVSEDVTCAEVSAELLRTEVEWDARMAELVPETYRDGRLPASLVDWTSETALIGYIDCGSEGIEVTLSDFHQQSGGDLSVEYVTAYTDPGGDILTRTYLIHAFASCGDCALASVTTNP